jgi:hypothetical protein
VQALNSSFCSGVSAAVAHSSYAQSTATSPPLNP